MIFATNANTVIYVVRTTGTYWRPTCEILVDIVVGVRTLPQLRARAIEVDALDPGERKARSGARRHKYRQVGMVVGTSTTRPDSADRVEKAIRYRGSPGGCPVWVLLMAGSSPARASVVGFSPSARFRTLSKND